VKRKSQKPRTSPSPDAGRIRHKVLVVDDGDDERMVLGALLEAEGFSVLLAQSAGDAFALAIDSSPDVVVSDVAMPTEDGIIFLRKLRSDPRTESLPVILVSGSAKSIDEQAEAHEFGADDYLTKPYSHKLLVSKIRTAIRRVSHKEVSQSILRLGIAVDLDARTVSFKEKSIRLTRKEFDLLTTFLRKPERVLSIPYLLETVWGYDPARYNDPATVHSHVSSLRRKLGPAAAAWIISVPGLGYRFSSTL